MLRYTKKIVLLMSLLIITTTLLPTTATAAPSYFGQNSSLVTNVKQNGNAKISFTVNATSSNPLTYKIYCYGGNTKPNYRVYLGKPLISGTVKSKCTITVTVPVMGNFYIASSNPTQYDDDYIRVTLSGTYYSNRIDWTQKAVDNFNATKKSNDTATFIGGLMLSLTLYATGVGAIASLFITTGVAGASLAINNSSTKNAINVTPNVGFSWQYKYVPTDSGYHLWLLVYKIGGSSVIMQYDLGVYTIR